MPPYSHISGETGINVEKMRLSCYLYISKKTERFSKASRVTNMKRKAVATAGIKASIIHDNYRALTRRINFHMQGGGMRRSGGYVD